MANCFRLGWMLSLLLAVVVGAALLQPELADELNLASWNLPHLDAQLRTAEALGEQYDREEQVVKARVAAKELVMAELFAGRWTLFEAAAAFRRVNRLRTQPGPRWLFPGDTEEERLCREVIEWTRHEAGRYPSAAADALARRLEADLRERLDQFGYVLLPDVETPPARP